MLGTYVLAYKLISIGGIIESGGILIFPLNYAIIDIITEVYGYNQTKKLIKYSFLCCLFFATIVPAISLLPAPISWHHQQEYHFVLGNVFRFFLSNSIGIVAGITINAYLIRRWKILLNGKHFWLRSIASSAIGEMITSIIADILAFLGTVDLLTLLKLISAIYFVKFFTPFC